MNPFKRLQEYFAFTKNEQKVFLFLSVVFLTGVAVKAYKAYINPPEPPQFDYAASDSVFFARSQHVMNDTVSAPERVKKVNLNSATKTDLMSLPGVGEATAERIMLFREERGSFERIDDLKKIKGIGEKKFEKLKPLIEVR